MPQHRIAVQVVYSHATLLASDMGLTTMPRIVQYGGCVLQLALPTPPFPALTWTGGATCGWGIAILEDGKPWLCDCHPSQVVMTRSQAKEVLAALEGGKRRLLAEVVPDSEEGWVWVRVAGQSLLLPVVPLRNILDYGITHIPGGQ